MEKLLVKVIKRDGSIVDFDKEKIKNAIIGANNEVKEIYKIWDGDIDDIVNKVIEDIKYEYNEKISVEDISTITETRLMIEGYYEVARKFIKYRYKRELIRQGNTTDKTIFELLNGDSEYWNKENSNKDAKVVTVQRDYIAGVTSTDIARRFLLPKDVCEAHDKGIIHQHDMDYMAQNALTNCCLINLDDMLQNGTVINGVQIDPQHRLLTATTVATQIITAVASSQYGGCTISLTHLSPFVRMSYETYLEQAKKYFDTEEKQKLYADDMIKKEVKDAVQTFNYQINSMSTTNGQAPFLSVTMFLDENPEYKKETAMLIEEFLNQRILGMKNEKGVYVTPAFPKLLYVLDEDNIHEDSEYWYLTVLAAKCSAKRLVPDYISAKMMKELKINQYGHGDVYGCMGRITAHIKPCELLSAGV